MLNPSVNKYVEDLVAAYSQITSIWLFGSRANHTARADSDWDLLVFGSQDILESISSDFRFRQRSIDLLIVYDNKNFVEPWGDRRKNGSLSGWAWKEDEQNTVLYRATKPIYDENGKEQFNVQVTQCKAIRDYPRHITT